MGELCTISESIVMNFLSSIVYEHSCNISRTLFDDSVIHPSFMIHNNNNNNNNGMLLILIIQFNFIVVTGIKVVD